ncbi:hypothetical protein GCM10027569_71630 [Flindersiella endophytica]
MGIRLVAQPVRHTDDLIMTAGLAVQLGERDSGAERGFQLLDHVDCLIQTFGALKKLSESQACCLSPNRKGHLDTIGHLKSDRGSADVLLNERMRGDVMP